MGKARAGAADHGAVRTPIIPVLLCGGSGTRLWPLSRRDYPKQFAALIGPESLFQMTARRLSGKDFAAPVVVTAADFRFIAAEQLAAAGVAPAETILEPMGRNTGPSVLVAALHALRQDPDALLLVAPSDHVIPDTAAFHAAIRRGAEAATAGRMVIFGVRPDRAETGYGWIEARLSGDRAVPLTRFIEKPDADRAAAMLKGGRHLWNMGIFLGRADAFVDAYRACAPDLVPGVTAALEGARRDLDFLRLDAGPWGGLRDISIDYAVMERSEAVSVVPYDGAWSDLGDWQAIRREVVAPSRRVTAIGCENTLLRSETDGQELVAIGLRDIVAVAMPDAVLVADIARAQDVKTAVEILRRKGAPQADGFPKVHRPWGWYETLVSGDRFQVKRIVVRPGGKLSLQSHVHRSEHWVVVTGTLRVTVDGTESLLAENQSVYIPLGAVHRLENPGRLDASLIEVQTGAYLGEDDIRRYDDLYARPEEEP